MEINPNKFYKGGQQLEYAKVDNLRNSFLADKENIASKSFSCIDFYTDGNTTLDQYQKVVDAIMTFEIEQGKPISSSGWMISSWIDSNTRGAMLMGNLVLELPLRSVFRPLGVGLPGRILQCPMEYVKTLRRVFETPNPTDEKVLFLFKQEEENTGVPIIEAYIVPAIRIKLGLYPATEVTTNLKSIGDEIYHVTRMLEQGCSECTVRPFCCKDKFYANHGLSLMGYGFRMHTINQGYYSSILMLENMVYKVLHDERAKDKTVMIGYRRISNQEAIFFNSILEPIPNKDAYPVIASVELTRDDLKVGDGTVKPMVVDLFDIHCQVSIANPYLNTIYGESRRMTIKDAMGFMKPRFSQENQRVHTALFYYYPDRDMRYSIDKAHYFSTVPVNMLDWDWFKK